MLTQEENHLLTQTASGTPGGDLFRRYWHPVAMSEELPLEGAPLNVRILSEELVLFRDDQGRPGLLGLHCAHRGTDLSYGRCEDGGLRCVYHGWLYDIHGRCLEQPGEPRGSQYYKEIRHLAYPCLEAGGLIFTYMGPGVPPPLPDYEWLSAPDELLDIHKRFYGCNYLQGSEGNYDPTHVGFLHRLSPAEMRSDWVASAAYKVPGTTDVGSGEEFKSRDRAPILELEETVYGLRSFIIRDAGPGKKYCQVNNFVIPNLTVWVSPTDGYSAGWHVPIDDTSHWAYQINLNRKIPVDKERLKRERAIERTPDHHYIRNQSNRYLQDREAMKAGNFTGMGTEFEVHDVFATESAGPIQDRTKENLGYTDMIIVAARKLLLRSIRDVREGHEVLQPILDSSDNRFTELRCFHAVIPSSADWRVEWAALAKES